MTRVTRTGDLLGGGRMTTLDFELEISPGAGDTYPVLARAPGGEAATPMRLPMALAELDRQLAVVRDAVVASSAVLRRLPTKDEQPIQALGRRLFEAVVADDVRSLYLASAQRAREQGSILRLVLRVRPPELARLPWEFLFDPGQQDYLGLAMPLVRYPDVLVARLPLHVAAPLRILGMVARPSDQHALDVTNEQRRLHNALAGLERDGLVELSWVAGQTYGDLQNALDKGPWNVFHFVGHGGYDRVADEGTVALADDAGQTNHVGADDLSRLLAEHHTLRLVLLNACDTGRGSALDAFSSTAGALMRRGIPAVVAMQFEITDSAAIRFAEAFYQNVAKRLPVDTGVMRARRELRLAKKDTLEWGTPVLYLRAPDGRIFDATTISPPVPPGLFQNQVAVPDVEALYDEALAAFWTEQWDEAVVLLREVLACRSDHPGAAVKLKQAERQQQLGTHYSQARAAAETLDWDQAVAGFTAVADVDPTYRDIGERLEIARRQQQLAGLQAEARRLHRAEQWAAVVKVGERLHLLDPAAADPDGLVTSAQAEVTAAEQAEQFTAQYRSGLRLLDAGQWQQAIETLEQLDPTYRDTGALLARARRELPDPPAPPPATARIVDDPKTMQVLNHHVGVNAVMFSPDGRQLATANNDRTARIWDTTSGQELTRLTHGHRVWAVTFSPDGRQLATASSDSTARIWDTTSGQELTKFTHSNVVWSVAFSPDGRRLATASSDSTARIWDTTSKQELAKLTHDNGVLGVAFSPDGRRLATAGSDSTVRIWDTTSKQELAEFTHYNRVAGVAFSPDGRWLATACRDSTARIWDTTSKQELAEFTHYNRVAGVAFSPDGRWLATACDDSTARIWDTTSKQELAKLTHDNGVLGVAFSPDGRRLATASADRIARIWVLSDDE